MTLEGGKKLDVGPVGGDKSFAFQDHILLEHPLVFPINTYDDHVAKNLLSCHFHHPDVLSKHLSPHGPELSELEIMRPKKWFFSILWSQY